VLNDCVSNCSIFKAPFIERTVCIRQCAAPGSSVPARVAGHADRADFFGSFASILCSAGGPSAAGATEEVGGRGIAISGCRPLWVTGASATSQAPAAWVIFGSAAVVTEFLEYSSAGASLIAGASAAASTCTTGCFQGSSCDHSEASGSADRGGTSAPSAPSHRRGATGAARRHSAIGHRVAGRW
jgi:hypothetical protein